MGRKSRHIINEKLSMKDFFPQLVSDQRFEGCTDKKTAPKTFVVITLKI